MLLQRDVEDIAVPGEGGGGTSQKRGMEGNQVGIDERRSESVHSLMR